MAASYDFSFNPDMRVSLDRVGESQLPVLVVDGALRDPQSLIEFAANETRFAASWTPEGGYPGVRAAAPQDYARALLGALGGIVEQAFFSPMRVVPADANCLMSMVTRRPEQLTKHQRIPHFDTPDPMRIAFLHYLGDEEFGGTAFYRHRATGLEYIRPEQEAEFCRLRDAEIEQAPPPTEFAASDVADYQQTAEVDARFNRLIVYRSQHLHSGAIKPAMNFSTDPRKGRLTATIFINYRPA